jgi:hypothetical protein
MKAFDPRGLEPDVLKEGSEVVLSGQVHPEMDAVENLYAGLMLVHELQTLPFPSVRRSCEVQNNIRIVGGDFVGYEASIEEERVRELRSQFSLYEDQEIVEQLLSVLVPRKRGANVIERAVVDAIGKQTVLQQLRNRHARDCNLSET